MPKSLGLVNGQVREVDVPATHATTVTTNAAGVATVTFPAGRFIAPPVVALTPMSTLAAQATIAEVTSITATQVVIKTWRTQSVGVVLGGSVQTVIVTAATVHLIATAAN